MSSAEAPVPAPEWALIPPQKQRSTALTRQILVAALLFDLAGAGTIFGLSEAQATQRQSSASSSQMVHGPSSAGPGHSVDGHD
jgi:hypothetical protein